MTCERYRGDVSCGSCGDRVIAGEPVYLVTKAKLRRCATCASRCGELPAAPDLLPLLERSQPETCSFGRFDRPQVGAALRKNILDFRARQAGEP